MGQREEEFIFAGREQAQEQTTCVLFLALQQPDFLCDLGRKLSAFSASKFAAGSSNEYFLHYFVK